MADGVAGSVAHCVADRSAAHRAMDSLDTHRTVDPLDAHVLHAHGTVVSLLDANRTRVDRPLAHWRRVDRSLANGRRVNRTFANGEACRPAVHRPEACKPAVRTPEECKPGVRKSEGRKPAARRPAGRSARGGSRPACCTQADRTADSNCWHSRRSGEPQRSPTHKQSNAGCWTFLFSRVLLFLWFREALAATCRRCFSSRQLQNESTPCVLPWISHDFVMFFRKWP